MGQDAWTARAHMGGPGYDQMGASPTSLRIGVRVCGAGRKRKAWNCSRSASPCPKTVTRTRTDAMAGLRTAIQSRLDRSGRFTPGVAEISSGTTGGIITFWTSCGRR